jgi:poly(3-hydroxybutyrate) depolymerase
LPQAKPLAPKTQSALFAAYVALPEGPASLAEQRRILGELVGAKVAWVEVPALHKSIQKLWEKGPQLEKDSGQAHFWPEEKRGLFIVGGQTRKPKALAICMHGGGAGSGDAWSAHGGYDGALRGLDWLAVYPEVLEKTEHGWTDAGTEEWVLELAERARRTWKLDPDRVYLVGHSMGGYGSWTLGAHHADLVAAIAPSAGAPTPFIDRSGKVIDISNGIVPNLRNLIVRIYQSDDDPQVPPDANRFAAKRLEEAKALYGGFDFEYWEVSGRRHDPPPGGYEAHLAKIEKARRNPHPDTVVWQPSLSWKRQFYWLFWEAPVKDALVVARVDSKANQVRVSCDKDAKGLSVLVDEELLDPKREIVVFLNEQEVFRGRVEPDLATILATGANGDPELAFGARIPLQ